MPWQRLFFAVCVGMPLARAHEALVDRTWNATRSLLAAPATSRTILIIRISASSIGMTPSVSKDELYLRIFSDAVSLKHHMARCSAGQLQLHPTNYGVMDVSIDGVNRGTRRTDWVQKAEQAALAALGGVGTIKDFAHHIMFVLPDRGDDFVGSAEICPNGLAGTSTYGDTNAAALSVLMHEIGHNLNLNHAGYGGDEYADRTGMMGISTGVVARPQSCYNAANHWSLNWFSDRRLDWSAGLPSSPTLVTIAAFVDYTRLTDPNMVVLVHLVNDLYLQYNRAKEHNIETRDRPDTLVLVRSKPNNGGTTFIASLDATSTTYSEGSVSIAVCRFETHLNGVDTVVVSMGSSSTDCQGSVGTTRVGATPSTPNHGTTSDSSHWDAHWSTTTDVAPNPTPSATWSKKSWW